MRRSPGFTLKFPRVPFFNEFVVTCPTPAQTICDRLERDGILAGLPLGRFYAGMERDLLVCVTETKLTGDIERLTESLGRAASQKV